MPRLSSLRDENLQTNPAPAQISTLGSYAYGLNVFLPNTEGYISYNSKRMECRFRLTSVSTSSIALVAAFSWSIRLGTERFIWFSDFVKAETILGDAVLPHYLPEGGQIIECGDSIVVQTRNDETGGEFNLTTKKIALLFQGEHIL